MFRRFRNMFSESSPCLLGQHGSCSTAQQPGNSGKTFYKTFRTSGRPTWYFFLIFRTWRHIERTNSRQSTDTPPMAAMALNSRRGVIFQVLSRYKDATHKEDFRNRTFVTLKRRYFSQLLQRLIHWTNQIGCFNQTMKRFPRMFI